MYYKGFSAPRLADGFLYSQFLNLLRYFKFLVLRSKTNGSTKQQIAIYIEPSTFDLFNILF